MKSAGKTNSEQDFEVRPTHRSPPPGIRYAAEWSARLIHLHRVHQSREGEDAHGDEQKKTAHLNSDRAAAMLTAGSIKNAK